MLERELLAHRLPDCCEMDAFPVSLCAEREKQAIKTLLPETRSVIVLAHHVQNALEWMWFPFKTERNQSTCAADLHLKSECEKIVSFLENMGSRCVIVPYPGRCGIRFKELAHMTGLGKTGDNSMFLHQNWGPWTHLRVIVTDQVISGVLPSCGEICIHCGACKASCPARVITDHGLLGEACDEFMDRQSDVPGWPKACVFKCEVCARSCPIGVAPEKIMVFKG